GAVIVLGVVISGYIAAAPQIPAREALWSIRRSPGMTFLDRNGRVIATRGAKYGQAVTLAQLPPYVPKAFLAAEDKRFYQHGPVDIHAIARALATDIRRKRSAEGASTLTQQLARTLFLKRDPSLKRKVQEAYLAWRLEQGMSKDDILSLYLNRTYFGDGAYGIDAASEAYFGKPASQLSLIEAATLAGLPNAPSRLALTNDMPDAVARAHKILQTMRDQNWISDADLTLAMSTQPVLAAPHNNEGDEGYVLDAAATAATQLAAGQAADLVVKTTIDPNLQSAGTDAVRSVVLGEGRYRRVSQGALVSLAPDGAILAMVGGLDHDKSAFNRVTQARRQPGSSFKAFVYGAAVEHGATEQTVRDDAPISYSGWNPENYGGSYAGPVTLQQALARSLNTVSVRLTLEVGPDTVAAFAHRLGVTDVPDHPGPSIALGAYEVTPLEMAAGYQVFQTGGGRTTPYLVSEIRTTHGDVIWSHNASAATPVLDPLFATRMVNMLKTVITSGTGTGANIGRPAAGKTGTSQDWRDAWFIGFTPDVLTAVWVGNDGGAPMAKVTGGELPAQIWRKFMTVAEAKLPPRDFPWLVQAPNMPPGSTTVADQASDAESSPYEDQPDMGSDGGPDRGDGGGAQADQGQQAAPDGADQEQPPPGYRQDRGRPYARGDYQDRANPYARDPYARDPYDDPRADQPDNGEDDRAPPPRWSRGWREGPPPDYGDDGQAQPPPRYQERAPYSSADGDPRDGY
ncbi:MAG TPA: PBP1A family penicillin-binding protein, partial [Caulobacteraceae bacterium]|nr:PBP1A family penicillin-binding protein [Caulobacteraceae bacterium]